MAVNSRFFGGGSYSSVQLAAVLARFLGNGFRQGVNNELACYASGTDLNVRTKTGEAFVNGYWVENTAEIMTAITPDATLPRYDRMVLHLDTATPSITINKLTGTAASNPIAPVLTRSGTVYEQPLCLIYVPAAAASIAAADVFDEREPSDSAGPLVVWLTNNSGVERVIGEVVIADTSANASFTTTTTARNQIVIGVVADLSVANAAVGRVLTHGMGMVLADAAVTRGQWLVSSTTAGKATPKSNREVGAFALALSTTASAGLVPALIMESPVAGTATATTYMPAAYDAAGQVGDSAHLGGQAASYYNDAGNLTGTIALARIPATLTDKDADMLDGYHADELLGGGIILGAVILFDGILGGSDGHRPMVGSVANESWHLMNGETVDGILCRDMRDRMPIGAGSTYAVGDTGGAATINIYHKHAINISSYNEAQHTHAISFDSGAEASHWHGTPGLSGAQSGTSFSAWCGGDETGAGSSHLHSVVGTSGAGSSHGHNVVGDSGYSGSTAQSVLNPYMGIFFIKKIA